MWACVLYLELRTGFIFTAHAHNPGQMWIQCPADVVVVIVVFRDGAPDGELRGTCQFLAIGRVFIPRDCDLLYRPGHGRGRGNVLVQVVLSCWVILFIFPQRCSLDNGRRETGAMCADLGLAEVERVQVALQAAVVQTLLLKITLRELLALRHCWDWQPCPNCERLNFPRNAFRHRPVKKTSYGQVQINVLHAFTHSQIFPVRPVRKRMRAQFSTFLCMLRMHSIQPRMASLDSWDRIRSQM